MTGFESVDKWAEDYSRDYDKEWRAHRRLIDNLLRAEEGLTNREIEFIESASRRLGREPEKRQLVLTDKQVKWAQAI